MEVINIDVETRSGSDLKKSGVYRYVTDPGFALLLFSYSVDDAPVQTVDLSRGEKIPREIREALHDPQVVKEAFNANFERIVMSAWLGMPEGEYLDPTNWRCTKVKAAEYGYIGSLEEVAEALDLPVHKDAAGTRLINMFAKPRKDGTFLAPEDDPENWDRFVKYNQQDVVVEHTISRSFGDIDEMEQAGYELDQRINDRGVLIDREMAEGAVRIADAAKADGMNRIRELTGVGNPNSLVQIKKWLESVGYPMESLNKESVSEALNDPSTPPEVRRYLKLRRATALSSVAKYQSGLNSVSTDNRIRGMFRFFGANTGRWAGRALQPQNLPRGGKLDPSLIRPLVKAGDRGGLLALGVSSGAALKDVIRTVMIAPEGKNLIVVDYSAIEARVLAWLAGEEWVLEVFRGDGKHYEATAARAFKVAVEDVTEDQRDDGKVLVLACGYQGSVGAVKAMGGESRGWDEDQMLALVRVFRDNNPHIVRFWYDLDEAFRSIIGKETWTRVGRVELHSDGENITIILPSGRRLIYANTEFIEVEKFGERKIAPSHLGRVTGRRGISRVQTYGGKLTENITQAVARDFLLDALMRLEAAGYRTVLHVHDEAVVEVPEYETVADIEAVMCEVPDWAEDFPMDADGFATTFYRK